MEQKYAIHKKTFEGRENTEYKNGNVDFAWYKYNQICKGKSTKANNNSHFHVII